MSNRCSDGNCSEAWTCVLPAGHDGDHIYSLWCEIAREAEAAIARVREACFPADACPCGRCTTLIDSRDIFRALDGTDG